MSSNLFVNEGYVLKDMDCESNSHFYTIKTGVILYTLNA